MDYYDRLRQFEILSHFADSQLEALAACSSRHEYDDGDLISGAGAQGHDTYIIDTGNVRIQRNTPYGQYPLADLQPGDLFGESGFLHQSARSGDAIVMGGAPAALFRLDKEETTAAMHRDKRLNMALYWAFWRSLSIKLRQTNEKLTHFFSRSETDAQEEVEQEKSNTPFSVALSAKRDLFREQKLSSMEINFLSTLSKEKRLAPHEVIFREGEQGDKLYVLLEGRVMISKQIAGAGEEALAILERGDYFGEMAMIDNKPRSADAKAHDEGAVVLSISREVLEGILDIQKVSSLRLLHLLCNLVAKRLREIDDKLIGWFIFAAGAGESLEVPGGS